MAPLHATPVAILMPHGVDNMVDPPPTSSHSRQPEWLRRNAPSDFIPPSLLSSLALEASRGTHTAGYPTSCLTGTRLGDVCLLLSAAGPARELISLTQLPLISTLPDATTIDAASLATPASTGYRPWYTRANAPLLQLALNFSSPEGWARINTSAAAAAVVSAGLENQMVEDEEVPILAARSASSVQFWKLEQQEGDPGQGGDGTCAVGGADADAGSSRSKISTSKRWKIKEESLGVLHLPSSQLHSSSTTADVAWCRHMTHRCVVLCQNGSLREVAIEDGASSSATTNNTSRKKKSQIEIPGSVGWAPNHQLLSELSFLESPSPSAAATSASAAASIAGAASCSSTWNSIFLRCAFTNHHPRHVVVSLHSRLGTVDLRSGGGGGGCYISGFSQEIYRCPPKQWISALSVPNLTHTTADSSSSSGLSHYVAASTATEILLFDLRRPHAVLASWEHSMTADTGGKVKGVDALYTVPPDSLTWLPPSSSSRGPVRGVAAAGGASTSAAAAAAALGENIRFSDHSYQLVASNASQGKAIVCEWNEYRTRGGIAAGKKGKLWEYSKKIFGNTDKEAEEEEEEEDDELEDAEFTFKPACWTEIQPEQPPRLLFNVKCGYPSSLAAVVDKGKGIQKHRTTVAAIGPTKAATGTTTRIEEEGEEAREEDAAAAVVPLQQREQQQQRDRAVRLLPSSWTGPAFLGISLIPLHQDWKRNKKIYLSIPQTASRRETRGDGSGGSGSRGGREDETVVLALLSPTQELTLTHLSNDDTTTASRLPTTNSSSVTNNGTASAAVQIVHPVDPEQMRGIDPGRGEEIRLDSQGKIMEDMQIILAKEAAAGVVVAQRRGRAGLADLDRSPDAGGGGGNSINETAAVERRNQISTYPQFRVKQPVYVGLSLHKWILEEAVRQYDMNPEEYQATFPPSGPPMGQQQQYGHEERTEELLRSAQVPFTAGEAWSALISPTSQQRKSTLFQGIAPSMSTGNKRTRAATGGGSGSGSGSRAAANNSSPTATETFIAALTRAGLIPLPPHIRAIPGKESNSTGLAAVQSRAAFFPPLPSFVSQIENAAGSTDNNDATNSQKLHVSTLKYKKKQLRAFVPPSLANGAEAAAGSSPDASLIGFQVQPPELASSEMDVSGHNIVFIPVLQESGVVEKPVMRVSVPGKPPLATAQAVLDELQREWEGITNH